MPRSRNSEERRRQIVAGLAEVMAERGYANATIQAIARAAGLTPGLLHYHFAGKRDILIALIEALAQTARARLRTSRASPRCQLRRAIEALVETGEGIEARAVACWVVIGAEAVRESAVRAVYEGAVRQLIAEFEGLLREAMRTRGGSGASAADAAVAVVAAVEGFFRLAAGAPSCVPPGSAAAAVCEIAEAFVVADGGGR